MERGASFGERKKQRQIEIFVGKKERRSGNGRGDRRQERGAGERDGEREVAEGGRKREEEIKRRMQR